MYVALLRCQGSLARARSTEVSRFLVEPVFLQWQRTCKAVSIDSYDEAVCLSAVLTVGCGQPPAAHMKSSS